jgi:hypothetical protein
MDSDTPSPGQEATLESTPTPLAQPTPIAPERAVSVPIEPPTFNPYLPDHQYVTHRPLRIQPPHRDPNVLHVVNPRRWGSQPQHPRPRQDQVSPAEAAPAISPAMEGSYDSSSWDDSLSNWREGVSQSAGPEQFHDAIQDLSLSVSASLPELETTPEAEIDEGPDRPDSAPPVTPPVIVHVSPEPSESESSSASTPRQQSEELLEPNRTDSPSTVQGAPNESETGNMTRTPRAGRPEITQVEVDGQIVRSPPRTPRHRRSRGPGCHGKWWIPDPHPAYGAEFGDRRLLVS